MTRETKEISTLSGKKVTINAYLTGPEANILKAVMFEGIEVEAPEPGEKAEKVKIPLSATVKREPKLIELSVVSFEEETDQAKAIEAINQLPSAEYADLITKIDAAHKGIFPEAK